MWLLAILSVLSIAVMIERAVFFIRARLDVASTATRLRKALETGGGQKALDELRALIRAPEVRILVAGMECEADGVASVEEAMGARRAVETVQMQRFLAFLGTLGPTAPFIGLFGTVLGIIGAFHNLAFNPQGGIGVVMAELSEALVATAAGLIVAIPAVIAYNVFMRTVQRRLSGASTLGGLYLSWLQGRSHRTGDGD
ncbi:MAG: MotA/TolQ/ExbB proton channel family protein [Deltaproteobacteria bacterium]|nr:MotA/TolQ/ExbB proton channel family protein [Deltaproteobacteria bacterium]